MADSSYRNQMDRTPLTSTTLASAGYDPDAHVLELEFCSGAVYLYQQVPASIYQDLLTAESKGSFFNQRIRDKFPWTLYTRKASA